MLIAALFIVTQDWKQPKYPSSGEWISKWRCISNGTAQSANTRNMDKSKNHCSKRKIDLWWSQMLTLLSFSHGESVSLHAGLLGLGGGGMGIMWIYLSYPPQCIFLISVLHPYAITPNLESLALMKIFLCVDSCDISCRGKGKKALCHHFANITSRGSILGGA